MNPSHSYALLALLLLTLLNAFFTLAETALNTVRNARLQDLIEEGGADAQAAGSAQQLMRQPTRVVATVQVGITLAAFAVAAIAAATLAPDWAAALPPRQGLTGPHPVRVMTVVLTLLAALVHHRHRRDRPALDRPAPPRSGRPADRPPPALLHGRCSRPSPGSRSACPTCWCARSG